MRATLAKLLLCIALLAPAAILPATPSQAHWDEWHLTTCQPAPEQSWYYVNSVYGGNRITYWRPSTGNLLVLWPMVSTYSRFGWECGQFTGLPISDYWTQQVCELGYCGPGAIQAFQRGFFAWHYGGYNAHQPQYHPW